MELSFPHEASGRTLELQVADQAAFVRLRDALGDPVWLVGS